MSVSLRQAAMAADGRRGGMMGVHLVALITFQIVVLLYGVNTIRRRKVPYVDKVRVQLRRHLTQQ